MRRLSVAAVAVFALAFAATGSAEVVRSHKGKAKNQAQTVPVSLVSFSAPASGSGKTKSKHKASTTSVQTAAVPSVAAAITTVASVPKTKAKHRASTGSTPAPLVSVAPVVNTASTSPGVRSGRHNTGTPVTGVSPLFLPVTNVTSTVASLNASGMRAGKRFGNQQINLPSVPSVVSVAPGFAAVPEPAPTSLVLIGLFGAALVMVRRFQAAKAKTVVP